MLKDGSNAAHLLKGLIHMCAALLWMTAGARSWAPDQAFPHTAYCAGAQRNDAKTFGIEWYEGERTIEDFYDSDITSYDYQAPISEAGAYGQPGSGGPNKFEASRLHPSRRVLGGNVCTELPAGSLSPSTCYLHGRDSAHAMSCSARSLQKPLGQRSLPFCLP